MATAPTFPRGAQKLTIDLTVRMAKGDGGSDGAPLLKDSGGVMMGKRAMTPVFGMSDVILEKKVDAVGIHAYVSVSLASAAKIKPR